MKVAGFLANKKSLLSTEGISERFAKTSRNIMRERVPPLQNSKNGHQKYGFAAHFVCGVFGCWRGGTRSRIVVLEVFAKCSLILCQDSTFILHIFEPKEHAKRMGTFGGSSHCYFGSLDVQGPVGRSLAAKDHDFEHSCNI